MASVVDLDRVRRNDDRLSTLQLILSGAVDLEALKGVLRGNTKVREVIIYVDESFLVELPVEETRDLFSTVGGMPNLRKLGFHSQSGSSGVLSIQALIAITSHATRMVHFGISDLALWGSQADFSLWATQLQTQLFLQSFCVCECELFEASKTCPLDPLLTVLSILPSLEALFLQAAAPGALGEVSPEALGSIGMAPQLQDLRLCHFELKHQHMEQLARVLPQNTVLSELKLDAIGEFKIETALAMTKILRHNKRLKGVELGMITALEDECALALAKSLHHNTSLESFTLSRGATARFRPTITTACQQAFVEMLHHNYCLESVVLFQRFPVKKEFKLYLTLNKFGRGRLLKNHGTDREHWVQAIHKVIDDLDSIFYYLSINPALCSHCDDVEEEEQQEEDSVSTVSISPPEQVCGTKRQRTGPTSTFSYMEQMSIGFPADVSKRFRKEEDVIESDDDVDDLWAVVRQHQQQSGGLDVLDCTGLGDTSSTPFGGDAAAAGKLRGSDCVEMTVCAAFGPKGVATTPDGFGVSVSASDDCNPASFGPFDVASTAGRLGGLRESGGGGMGGSGALGSLGVSAAEFGSAASGFGAVQGWGADLQYYPQVAAAAAAAGGPPLAVQHSSMSRLASHSQLQVMGLQAAAAAARPQLQGSQGIPHQAMQERIQLALQHQQMRVPLQAAMQRQQDPVFQLPPGALQQRLKQLQQLQQQHGFPPF